MNDLEAIKKAIYIIENSANTHEPEVDETLKRLQVIVKRKEYYNAVIIRSLVYLMPNKFRQFIYKHFLRKKAVDD